VPPDMSVVPDLKSAPPDMMPPPPRYTATIVLAEYSTVTLVAGMPVPIKILNPVVTFSSSANAKAPDYTSITNPNLPLGCAGNHYDITGGDTPEVELNGGDVTFTGYKQAMFLTGGNAPASITCKWDDTKKTYGCVYTGTTTDPSMGAYAATADTMPAGTMLQYTGAGNGNFGTFDVKTIAPAGPITTTENTNTITWDPTKDTTLTLTCSDDMAGKCGSTAVVVNLQITGTNTNTFGAVRCAQLAVGGTIKIEQKALAAAFGCKTDGTTCDANLKTVRTVVLRVPLPSSMTDSKMNSLTLLGGHGAIGQVTK
jgi:hypothetical protein